MSILTATRPDVKLTIKGLDYSVSKIDPGEEGTAAFRLGKLSGEGVYDVVRTHGGLVKCDCPSYVMTYEGTPSTCKHGKALVEAGYLDKPSPVANSSTAPAPVKPAPRPITRKDQVAARTWGLKLPVDAPLAVEAPALAPAPVVPVVEPVPVPAENPRDAWPAWTDEGTWELGPEAKPIEAPAPSSMSLAGSPVSFREPTGPRPTWSGRFNPTPEEDAERLGYELGNAGEDARASEGRSFPELVAFYGGWLAGRADQEAEYDAWLASVEADHERMDDAFGGPEATWHPAELAEARSHSGHPA